MVGVFSWEIYFEVEEEGVGFFRVGFVVIVDLFMFIGYVVLVGGRCVVV